MKTIVPAMPDNTANSTVDAINRFQGYRTIRKFYSNRSGELDKALRQVALYVFGHTPSAITACREYCQSVEFGDDKTTLVFETRELDILCKYGSPLGHSQNQTFANQEGKSE